MTDTRPTGWPGDPVSPPSMEEIEAAAIRLEGTIVRTPLMRLKGEEDIYLKPEVLQPIGSFKVRGVGNWALSLDAEDLARGLTTVSAGNTAQAVGYMGKVLGVSSRSLVPHELHPAKRQAIERYGTELVGVTMTELMLYMFDEGWREEPYCYLNPWGEPAMVAGHGTIGLELVDDLGQFDSVFVPVGGGALAAGIAAAVKHLRPGVKVFGVQAEENSSLKAAFDKGGPVWIDWRNTIVEGASTPLITHNMYPMLVELIDDVIVVSEDEVKGAMGRLLTGDKLVTEGAGAAAVAAALKTEREVRGVSVAVVSGGSVDPGLLSEVIGSG